MLCVRDTLRVELCVQPLFLCDRKILSHETLREDRTAAVRKCVAEATRRRRRILRAGFFL